MGRFSRFLFTEWYRNQLVQVIDSFNAIGEDRWNKTVPEGQGGGGRAREQGSEGARRQGMGGLTDQWRSESAS